MLTRPNQAAVGLFINRQCFCCHTQNNTQNNLEVNFRLATDSRIRVDPQPR